MNRACVIVLHFGQRPGWFELWRSAASRNPEVDFQIVSDCIEGEHGANIHVHRASLADLNNGRFLSKEGLAITSPYKCCDFRPLFGEMFAEIVAPYAYWGWGDLDVLYGDIMGQLGTSLGHYDYVATGRDGQSGPLAFLRNSEAMNSLWRTIPEVHARLNGAEPVALDEIAFLEVLQGAVTCDLEFRECLDDLPARWVNGKILAVETGKEYVLHHFGGRLSHTRAGIVRRAGRILAAMDAGQPVRIGARGEVYPETAAAVCFDRGADLLRAAKRRLWPST